MDYTYYKVLKHKGLLSLINKNGKKPLFRLRKKHFLNFIITVTKSKIELIALFIFYLFFVKF